ncbi:MFS transporter [Gryllotalpicola reticulitermitis]|uniref:MFS transporter n=1 Tax=Gryllotalpicola reticulitermitis TaxID=1184153 RepID=A0ABV8QB35_9MICO
MTGISADTSAEDARALKSLGLPFWLYWSGQTAASLGGAIAQFALPLIVFQLTGSGLALGAGFAVSLVPQLLFGLVIGALGDRMDRRRVMVVTDFARAACIAVVPILALAGLLDVVTIYAVLFVQSVLGIFFQTASNAGVPRLVRREQLVRANGQLQVGSSAAMIVGPFLAGLAVTVLPVTLLLFAESATFLISAITIVCIRVRLNEERRVRNSLEPVVTKLVREIGEGLSYVWRDATLRNISIMMAIINFAGTTVTAQLPLFVKRQFGVGESRLAWFYVAAGVGILLITSISGIIRKRAGVRLALFGCLSLEGAFTILLGITTHYWLALVFWAVSSGASVLFNVYTMSLRQALVPDELMSRVMSVAAVVAWSAIPLGALVGGAVIQAVRAPGIVYAGIGCTSLLVVALFLRSDLGRDVASANRVSPADDGGGRA